MSLIFRAEYDYSVTRPDHEGDICRAAMWRSPVFKNCVYMWRLHIRQSFIQRHDSVPAVPFILLNEPDQAGSSSVSRHASLQQ